MAVRSNLSEDGSTLNVEIDNGDLIALNASTEVWKLRDPQTAVKFALGILRSTPDGKIFLNQAGNYVQLVPAQDALKPTGAVDGEPSAQ